MNLEERVTELERRFEKVHERLLSSLGKTGEEWDRQKQAEEFLAAHPDSPTSVALREFMADNPYGLPPFPESLLGVISS